MKKINLFIVLILCLFTLTACSNNKKEETKQEITITSLNANKEKQQLTVPYNPKRVAVLDMAALDILDTLGLSKRVVGMASTSLEYLSKYANDENIKNLGTIKEANLEAIMAVEPDIIFIGGRLSASYDELSQIAPVVLISTDSELGVVESTKENAKTIASIFGKEDLVEEKMATFTSRIEKLQSVSKDKNALIAMATSGSLNLLGNDARCSLIGNEIGFNNLTQTSSTHGNETSFELIVQANPDYLFVLDRDAAIETEGAKIAKDIVENELIKQTDTYKNNHIIYLDNSAIWYTAEGGIKALDFMLQDLEKHLL